MTGISICSLHGISGRAWREHQMTGWPFTGATALEAFERLEVLESTAEAIINWRAVGELKPLGGEVARELDRAFFS